MGVNVNGVNHLGWWENGTHFAVRNTYKTNFAGGGMMTTDPVCGMTVDEKKKSEYQAMFAGRNYFFCSEDCMREFEADPGGYVETAAA
jgi:Cu+-exporting ATPase